MNDDWRRIFQFIIKELGLQSDICTRSWLNCVTKSLIPWRPFKQGIMLQKHSGLSSGLRPEIMLRKLAIVRAINVNKQWPLYKYEPDVREV